MPLVQRWFNWHMTDVSKVNIPDQVLVLLNVRINSQFRAERLNKLLKVLGPSTPISLRVRSDMLNSALVETLHSSPNIDFFSDSSFKEWKLDLLEQVAKSDCDYYVLIQEDHFPVVSLEVLRSVLDYCARHGVDFMPLSFFPQYQQWVNSLSQSKAQIFQNQILSVWNFDKKFPSNESADLRIYPVNLIGFFSKDLLLRILRSEHPFFKRYPIDSPFDFEQPYDQTWYLPIKWAFPAFELLACIDDDHGIPGYSLSARGNYTDGQRRQVDHHPAGSVLGVLSPKLFFIKQMIIRMLPNRLLVLPRNLKYTFQSLRGFRKRRHVQKKLLGNS
jgi:hypothetical protein